MELKVSLNLLRTTAAIFAGITIMATALAQTPAPTQTAAPTAAAAPVATQAPADPAAQALEPVRQAIGQQDYQAAQQALDQVRQSDPTNPGIPLYEGLIQRRANQGQVNDGQSPLRTPRPGVTPMPAPVATPEPAPAATPAPPPAPAADTAPAASEPASAAATDDIMGKAKALLDNEMVRYGIIGVLVLIALWVIFSFLKKRRDRPTDDVVNMEDEVTPVSGVTTIGGMDDHLGDEPQPASFGLGGAGAATAAAPTDFSQDFSGATDSGTPTASSAGGSALGAPAEFTTFGADDDDENESAPPPRPKPAPKPAVDDDAPVSFHDDDDEPPATAPAATPPPADTLQTPAEPSESVSFDTLGINFGGTEEPPAAESAPPPTLHPPENEETVILSAPESAPVAPAASSNPTPTASPSLTPGTVDLEDFLGSQNQQPAKPEPDAETLLSPIASQDKLTPAPETPADDANSETLPTFVSTPGAGNPEDSVEVPPNNQRRKTEESGQNEPISFEELFGTADPSADVAPEPEAEPEPAPAPEPAPEPEPAQPAADVSIEDALAATLGDMEAQTPDFAMADEKPAEATEAQPAESLDDRTERMFAEQMDKARKAVEDKNWRQAVHVLSIASALHPENEEAKSMLKEARAEKRKAEESV